MVRSDLRPWVLGSTIIRLLIGPALIAGIPVYAGRATPPAGAPPHLQRVRDVPPSVPPGSATTIPDTLEWRFNEPQPDWKPTLSVPGSNRFDVARTNDALRITMPERPGPCVPDADFPQFCDEIPLVGGVYVDLPDWRREEWAELLVSVRTRSSVTRMSIGLNPSEGIVPQGQQATTFQIRGGVTPIVRDGLVHTYRIHLDWGSQRTGPWRRIGLLFRAPDPGSIDILSVRAVPTADEPDRVTETTLDPAQLRSDFALFRKALEEAHPALYRYTTKRAMDAQFARAEAKLTRPMTILEFRNVLAPVVAAIKDGHTHFTDFQGDEISALRDRAKQFPLALMFESTRAFVVLNQGLEDRVRPGMEVLAINGTPFEKILERLLSNLSQDGDTRSHQLWGLGLSRGFFQIDQGRHPGPYGSGFSEAYRLYIGNPSSFRTTLRDPRTRKNIVVDLHGVTRAEAAVNSEQNPANRDVLTGLKTLRALGQQSIQSIRYLAGESTAILNPGFQQNFPAFLKKTFAELKSNGATNLIIDLRGNTGGQDTYPSLLCSYLTSTAFHYAGQVHMNTYQPSFKQYTDLPDIDSVTDSYYGSTAGIWTPDPRGGWLMTDKYPAQGVHKPSENQFDGTIFVLMDGGSFSAGSGICPATSDAAKRMTVIGEEAGGAAESSSGGGDIGPTLPESHLHIGIPMESSFSVVDKSVRRRGTLPKYVVRQILDDLAKGRDTALEFTRELIRTRKGR